MFNQLFNSLIIVVMCIFYETVFYKKITKLVVYFRMVKHASQYELYTYKLSDECKEYVR